MKNIHYWFWTNDGHKDSAGRYGHSAWWTLSWSPSWGSSSGRHSPWTSRGSKCRAYPWFMFNVWRSQHSDSSNKKVTRNNIEEQCKTPMKKLHQSAMHGLCNGERSLFLIITCSLRRYFRKLIPEGVMKPGQLLKKKPIGGNWMTPVWSVCINGTNCKANFVRIFTTSVWTSEENTLPAARHSKLEYIGQSKTRARY